VSQDGGIFLEFVDRGKTLRVKIRSLTPSHAGTYTCNAKNHLGHDEKSSTLTVQCTQSTASSASDFVGDVTVFFIELSSDEFALITRSIF